jgi:hypothetical protein
VTQGSIIQDIGICSSSKTIQFISYRNLSGRSLFRGTKSISYGNVIDCKAEALFGNISLNKFYFNNVITERSKFYNEDTAEIHDSVFINVAGTNEIDIHNKSEQGEPYKILERIPLECKTTCNKHNRITLVTGTILLLIFS